MPRIIAPQPGPQTAFAKSNAQICIFGGSAGSGKTWALAYIAGRYVRVPGYSAIIFRRTSPELRGGGSVWEEARPMYAALGGRAREDILEWRFHSGATIKFNHLQYEKDKFQHQGKAYAACVAKGTPILLANGEWQSIERIASGTMVATLEGPKPVLAVHLVGISKVHRLTANGRSALVSSVHPLLSALGWVSPDELTATESHATSSAALGAQDKDEHDSRPVYPRRHQLSASLVLFEPALYPDCGPRIVSTYAHPYTNELRPCVHRTGFFDTEMAPAGEAEVWDLTVADASHYVTWGGFIARNCFFDEVTHFTRSQFFYLVSRNRNTVGVPSIIRATCNPDPDSFVREMIDWWIDENGLAIPDRSGVVRWFGRDDDDKLTWGDTKEELEDKGFIEPKSLTFIPAKLTDNPALLSKDPKYLGNLMSMDKLNRERLLYGNWNIRPSRGLMFKRSMFEVIDAAPSDVTARIRAWDFAATESRGGNDPDYTVGALVARTRSGATIIEHVERLRARPHGVEQAVKNIAGTDGPRVTVALWEDPGAAGKTVVDNYKRLLNGYTVRSVRASRNKVDYANPWSAQAEAGNVKILRGAWNDAFLGETEAFPEVGHDDQVDAVSLAYMLLWQKNVDALRGLAKWR